MRISRAALREYLRFLPQDAAAGLVGAVAGAPQAMGFALVAGVAPVYGLYGAVVTVIVGALASGSRYMTIAPTNALALLVFSALGDGGQPIERLFTLTLLVGACQLAAGLLRLGALTRFVSNAVMVGFISGAGLLIILGQLAHLNGYEPQAAGPLPRLWDWLAHLPQSQPHTLAIGMTATVIIAGLHRTRFKSVATLVALAVTSAFVLAAGWGDVATVRDIAPIPGSLPAPALPDLSHAPGLLPAALALALLGLVQSAALTRAVREPDGSAPDTNRDFVAQGLGNLAGSLFQALPSAGSLSRTAVNVSAGAKTRLANLLAGAFTLAILLLLGSVIEVITLAGLAGHLVVAAFSLINRQAILLVWRVHWAGRAAMVATFVSALLLPLEQSVYVGVALSLALYAYTSSNEVHVTQLIPLADRRFREAPPPAALPPAAPVIFSVTGSLYFAAVRRLEDALPPPDTASGTVVILRLRGQARLGSTGIDFMMRYAGALRARGGDLLLAGVSASLYDELTRTGSAAYLGTDHIFSATDTYFEATEAALAAARRLTATSRA